jgi:hypothetical protein
MTDRIKMFVGQQRRMKTTQIRTLTCSIDAVIDICYQFRDTDCIFQPSINSRLAAYSPVNVLERTAVAYIIGLSWCEVVSTVSGMLDTDGKLY